jgi:hypothetical protein
VHTENVGPQTFISKRLVAEYLAAPGNLHGARIGFAGTSTDRRAVGAAGMLGPNDLCTATRAEEGEDREREVKSETHE